MRLPLEHWGMLTKHANPHDRAWQNGDVRELVVLAMSLQAQLERVRDSLDSVCEWCADRCRCARKESP